MSAGRKQRRDRSARAVDAPRVAPRGSRVPPSARFMRLTTWVALVIAGSLTFFLWRRPAIGTRPASIASPVDTMQITVAYAEATRLVEQERYLASLPFYRRVGGLLPQPVRDYELLIAHALRQAAMESRSDSSADGSRSSVERVAYLTESLGHMDRALGLSRTPREIADVHVRRAKLMHIWGFPWEALLALRVASAADPSWTEITEIADLYAYHLHHPEVDIPGMDPDGLLETPRVSAAH